MQKMVRKREWGLVAIAVAFAVVTVVSVALISRLRVEAFGTVLKQAARPSADPSLCTLWPSGYSFDAEGLVAHPTSSAADPKCIMLRRGMGLLKSDDPTACIPQSDQPDVGWFNPLNDASFDASVGPDYVAGLDRCTIRFAKDASASRLQAVDTALSVAGAELLAGLPTVQDRLEKTTASLGGASKQLGADSTALAATTKQLAAMTAALASVKAEQGHTQQQFDAMNAANEAARQKAASQYQSQISSGQQAYMARIADQASSDQRLMGIAGSQAAAAAQQQQQQCANTKSQIQQQANQSRAQQDAQLSQIQQQCAIQAQQLRQQAAVWENQC